MAVFHGGSRHGLSSYSVDPGHAMSSHFGSEPDSLASPDSEGCLESGQANGAPAEAVPVDRGDRWRRDDLRVGPGISGQQKVRLPTGPNRAAGSAARQGLFQRTVSSKFTSQVDL